MKTVLFIPGFSKRDCTAVIDAIASHGYSVKFVPIKYARTTIDNWVAEVDAIYTKLDPQQTILAGFSCGAMAALVSASKINPAELWLFSLSPYFAEDFKNTLMDPSWGKSLGKRRMTVFEKTYFKKLANNILCKTILFVGQYELNEWPIMVSRQNHAKTMLKNSELIIVPNSGHDVTDKKYIQAIKNSI